MLLFLPLFGTVINIIVAMPFVNLGGPVGTIFALFVITFGWAIASIQRAYAGEPEEAFGCIITALIAGFGGLYGFSHDSTAVMAKNWHIMTMPPWFIPAAFGVAVMSLTLLGVGAIQASRRIIQGLRQRRGSHWAREVIGSALSGLAAALAYGLFETVIFTVIASVVITMIALIGITYALISD